MTNKATINNIDVTKCKYYDKDSLWHCANPKTHSYLCKNNLNCKYTRQAIKEAR